MFWERNYWKIIVFGKTLLEQKGFWNDTVGKKKNVFGQKLLENNCFWIEIVETEMLLERTC